MSLLQISEPGLSPEPHRRRHAIGIDLGTTNSLVAVVRSGTPETLADEEERHLLPSVVHYGAGGDVLVGHSARKKAALDSLNTLVSVKRYMGRGVADIATLGSELPYELSTKEGGMVCFRTRAGLISPVEASAEILRVLEQRAELALDAPVDGAVITVPAYFDDAQRQATKDAAMFAGLKVLRLLNEPTAAAVAYGLDRGEEGVIAIYDLGGGTFDISILRLSRGVFEVLATGGDSALGGDDFDRAIADWIRSRAGLPEALSPQQQRELLDAACAAKETLTDRESAEIAVAGWQGIINREQFVELADGLIDKTLRACKRALRDAGLKPDEVADVVMVGGATRIPRVRQRVAELFGCQPHVDIDPDRVVALGAALQADVLVGNKPGDEMLLLDVIPLSLGLETMGGLMEKIIHRNTTIPVSMAQDFTTFKDGQTAMAIHVLQGERELVSDSRSLARFELRGIPPMVAGAAKVRVTFQVDADGLLNVSARELTSGIEAHIEVKPSYGLSEEEVTNMLQESYRHAREDMQIRALREQQVEADRMIEDLTQALALDGRELLSEEEYHHLEVAIENLRQSLMNITDHRKLAHEIEAVAKTSEEFASRRMNYNIRKALTGHTLDEVERDA